MHTSKAGEWIDMQSTSSRQFLGLSHIDPSLITALIARQVTQTFWV
jgi:hypothetical protein